MKGQNPFSTQNRQLLAPLGRKQVFDACLRWLQSSGSHLAYVTGFPGLGKSFLLAWAREHARYELYLDVLIQADETTGIEEFQRSITHRIITLGQERYASQLSIREQRFFEELAGKEVNTILEKMHARFARPAFKLFIAIDSPREISKEIRNWMHENVEKFPCETKVLIAQKTNPHTLITQFELTPPSIESFENWTYDALKGSKIAMGPEALRATYEASAGIPGIIIETLNILYQKLPDREQLISKNTFTLSKAALLDELSPLFGKIYSRATTTEKKVLFFLAKNQKEITAKEIQKQTNFTQGTLSKLLERLCKKECIQKKERGTYMIFCPLFGDYVLIRLGEP